MSEDEVKLKFSLDAKDAVGHLNEITEKIKGLGESKNLSGLINGFVSLSGPIFVAGAALLAVKQAMDFTKEGEAIIRIQNTFEALADQSGVNARHIEEGIGKSTKGLVDMDDALKSANKAMIQLGKNSARIPEIMDLARRAGKVFGVDTLEAFEAISQSAATGATRQLRQLGIIIDSNKAYTAYAKSIGVTTSSLSEQGRQTALLNAILEKGNSKFKELSGNASTFTAESIKLGVALKEIGDQFSVWVAKKYGEFFADATAGVTKMVKSLTGTNSPSDRIKNLDDDIQKLQLRIAQMTSDQLQRSGKSGLGLFWQTLTDQQGLDAVLNLNLIQAKKKLAEMNESLSKDKAANPEAAKEVEGVKKGGNSGDVDSEKTRLQAAQFNRELLVLKEARLKSGMAIETNALQFTQDLGEQEVLIVEQYNARIEEIKAKGAKGEEMTQQQAADLIIQIEEEKKNKIIEFEREKEQASLQVYENQLKAAKTTTEGIQAGFRQQGMLARKESQDYGKQGVMAFNIVNSSAKKFFVGLGEGSKDAGQLMREFLFGVLADYAEQSGAVLLAEGIGTYDGVKIAEGGALLALSGLIRGLAGGGGGGSSSSGGGGAGSSLQPENTLQKPELQEQQKKSVTIQVSGNYFETEQTKTRLTEMIRESSDATDYKFQQIGVK